MNITKQMKNNNRIHCAKYSLYIYTYICFLLLLLRCFCFLFYVFFLVCVCVSHLTKLFTRLNEYCCNSLQLLLCWQFQCISFIFQPGHLILCFFFSLSSSKMECKFLFDFIWNMLFIQHSFVLHNISTKYTFFIVSPVWNRKHTF